MSDANMQQCIDTCQECHRTCLDHFSNVCLEKGGEHVEQTHARLMLDCIQICATCADFMIRGSELHGYVCRACSEVCKKCADSCEKVGMTECADQCRKCAETCAAMAA
ncbi:four-helix bundle copper-binding protein [Alienimonas sp. DA493]|uniref:four-helix bundle copper-binding protein n=1 Tax=Alienimonas sp. DA493 TaxID=3373605 RepID=UPI003754D757